MANVQVLRALANHASSAGASCGFSSVSPSSAAATASSSSATASSSSWSLSPGAAYPPPKSPAFCDLRLSISSCISRRWSSSDQIMLSLTSSSRARASRSFTAAVYNRASRSKSDASTSAGSGRGRRASLSHASYMACTFRKDRSRRVDTGRGQREE